MTKNNSTGCIGLTETPVVFLSRPTIPFALQLHVNERCNLRCKHCYSESWKKEMEFENFLEIVDQFKDLLRLAKAEGTVYLTGGEPLLWPHMISAIKTLVKYKIAPRVLTNGTLITRAYAEALKKAGTRYVQVSLDGSREIHDSIRGQGSFDRAIRGIRCLVSHKLEVTIMTTLMKRNLDDIRNLVKIAEELGVTRIAFGRFISIGNGSAIDDDLSKEDIIWAFKELETIKDATTVEIVQRDPLWSAINTPSGMDFAGCAAGQLLLDVLVDGTVLPCRRLPIPVGNVFELSLLDIWLNSSILRKLRNRSNLECSSCSKVRMCGGCRGVAYASTGDMLARDPQCILTDDEQQSHHENVECVFSISS